jgi:long-chain fatty acid transport protein
MNTLKLFAGVCALWSTQLIADPYHYKNILIGERASGLGGAFVAVSDDPSGIFYNPAGLAYSFENYLSLSANAFCGSKQTFKNVKGGQDYNLSSSTFVPAFFGFTQYLGSYKMAFAIIVPDSDLLDQQDTLKDFDTTTGNPNYLTRKFFKQDQTFLIGPAFAKAIAKNFSIGITLFGAARTGKTIDNQMVATNPLFTGDYYWVNTSSNFNVYSFNPKLGIQFMPSPKYSLGFTVARPVRIKGTYNVKQTFTKNASDASATLNGSFENDITTVESTNSISAAENFQFSLGQAYFFSKSFMVSADVDVFLSDAGPSILAPGLNVKTGYNWAVGAEYFISQSLPIRAGFYSNNSNTKYTVGDATSVDLLSASLGVSLLTSGTSFTLGGTYSWGKGKGQILQGSDPSNPPLNDLHQTSHSIFIMGSYQL